MDLNAMPNLPKHKSWYYIALPPGQIIIKYQNMLILQSHGQRDHGGGDIKRKDLSKFQEQRDDQKKAKTNLSICGKNAQGS